MGSSPPSNPPIWMGTCKVDLRKRLIWSYFRLCLKKKTTRTKWDDPPSRFLWKRHDISGIQRNMWWVFHTRNKSYLDLGEKRFVGFQFFWIWLVFKEPWEKSWGWSCWRLIVLGCSGFRILVNQGQVEFGALKVTWLVTPSANIRMGLTLNPPSDHIFDIWLCLNIGCPPKKTQFTMIFFV